MATSTKEYLIKTVYDSTGMQKFVSDVDKARTVADKLGTTLANNAKVMDQSVTTSLNKAGQTVRNVTTVFDNMGTKTKVAFQEVAGNVAKTDASLGNLGKAASGAEIDIGKLAARAAVTIPAWLALRTAVMGTFQGIRDGVQNLLAFDAAMQKLRGNLDGTAEQTKAALGPLREQFTALSLQTGISVVEIANAFQKFATVGFGVKESMEGAAGSTKLAVAFFGDATETANAFARGLRVLVDQSQGTESSQKQIGEAMALTSELWKKNAFEISEMNQGLEKFSAAAGVAKMSMREVLILLATMGTAAVGGARGGTLLRTSMADLAKNAKDVAAQIGVQLNPALDTSYTALHKVVDALEKMNGTERLNITTTGALGKIFGGVRGALPIEALIEMNKLWRENEQLTGNTAGLNERVAEVLDSESGQAKILNNALVEMGKQFVQGLAGSRDFTESLKNLNNYVHFLTPVLHELGDGISKLFSSTPIAKFVQGMNAFVASVEKADKASAGVHERIVAGLTGKLNLEELSKLKAQLSDFKIDNFQGVNIEQIKKSLDKALSSEQVAANAKLKIVPVLMGGQAEAVYSIENALNELKARLKAKGATEIELQLLDVQFLKSQSIQDVNKIRDEQSKIRVETLGKERSIQDALLKSVEEGAKAEGASTLVALTRRIEMEKSLGIERTGMDLLTQQLELQKALTEETKKTKEERMKDLANLIKKTPSPFSQNFGGGISQDFKEQQLRSQASARGISEDQINGILNPEKAIGKGNSLLKDLQTGLAQPMTKSMTSLEFAISSLTQTILQQETRPLDVSVPRYPTVIVKDSAAAITKPGSKANQAVKSVIDDF